MIDVYSSSSNLGDNLGITALCALTPVRVHMFDDPGNREIAKVFDGVAEVVHDNGSPTTGSPKSSDPTHLGAPLSVRHLLAHGFEEGLRNRTVSAIPTIKLTSDEIRRAVEFLRPFKNPCIIKASPQEVNSRTVPSQMLRDIVGANPGVDFLSFSLSSKHLKTNTFNEVITNTHQFYDLDIRLEAAIYAVVGRYVGCDSGDYHLMLATGGKADVLVPPELPHYPYHYFHYVPRYWGVQPVRVMYHTWTVPHHGFITGLTNPHKPVTIKT